MNNPTEPSSPNPINGWRIAGWGALIALLILPAAAMQFTREVNWTTGDFVFAAFLLFSLGFGIELAMRVARGGAQLAAMVVAVIGGFLTVWLSGAVGIVGNEAEAVNLGFVGLVFAGVLASVIVWFRPRAMMAIMVALTLGQFVLIGVAIAQGISHWQPALMFVFIWALAALLFRRAAFDR